MKHLKTCAVIAGIAALACNSALARPPTPEPEPSDVYRFVGFSPITAESPAVNGGVGINKMHAICQAAFDNSNARMCNTKEFIDSPNIADIEPADTAYSWIHPFVVGGNLSSGIFDYFGQFYLSERANCRGWNMSDSSRSGAVIEVDSSNATRLRARECDLELTVTCCVPYQ